MKKRNLIIACMSLTCGLLIASVGATVAWFGFGGGLKADTINIQFIGDKELKISLNGTDFSENIEPQNSNLFEPVSSMYSNNWLNDKENKPKFKKSYSKGNIDIESTYRETGNAVGGFFQDEIYLKSDENVYVTIDPSQPIIIADEVANKEKAKELLEDSDKTLEEITKNLNSIKDSLRISILDPDLETYSYTIIDPYKTGETMLAGPLSLSGKYFDYYSKGAEQYELMYGEYTNEDKIIYDEPLESDIKPNNSDDLSCFNAYTRQGVRKFNLEKSLENGFTPAIENSLTKQQASDLIKIPLNAFEPKKLVVSIYIEGWDLDNTTETMYGSFIANLKFKIAGRR